MTIQRKRVAKRLASGLLAGALALGGLAISGGTASAETPSSPTTNRIYGASRYETAVALARNAANSPTSGLVIASGESYADALAAAPLTTANRPLLLVKSDSVPEIVLDYISDNVVAMGAATPTIYVVGGESAISADVFDTIKSAVTIPTDLTPPTVKRVSGADRYATALEIGKLVAGVGDKVVIVSGTSWADALSASNVAAENGWPIVLSGPSGLDASGKALIAYYEALPGVTPSYLIIGGPAAVPGSVESHLISTNLNAPAAIRRIAGADRYQTNLFTNVYLYGNGDGSASFNGDVVALVSGEAPWDGIASSHWAAVKNAHISLTKSGSLDASTAALSGTLAGLAAIGNAAGDNGTLYVIGGKSAVSDAVKTAYIASSTAVNTTSTVSGCNDGSKHLLVTLGAAVSAAEAAVLATDNIGIEAALLLNNAAVNTGATVTNSGDNQTFKVVLNSALTALNVVTFAGVSETVGLATRSIAGSSCTVVDDLVRPTVTIRAISGLKASSPGEGGVKIIVSASEPITFSSGSGALVTAGGLTFGSASNDTSATISALGVAVDTSYYTDFIIIPSSADTSIGDLAATTAVSLQAANIVDRGGNSPLVVATAAVNDVSAPVVSVASADCSSDGTAATRSLGGGALVVTAKDAGKWDGAIGNTFTVAVVNSRGLEMPTIAVDTTARTIVVTADTGYHTGADVDAVAKSMFLEDALLGDWEFSGTAALTTAATTTPLPLATGESTCTLLLTGNEPFQVNTAVSATVNGLGSGFVGALSGSLQAHDPTDAAAGKAMAVVVTHTTKVVGDAYLSVTTTGDNSINDVNGISVATAITYTVS